MISVLIPIYNYNCFDLVQSISEQCLHEKIAFEIICVDDASTVHEIKIQNRSTQQLTNVHYQELSENIGRTRIRPLLAQKAQFDHLLFLDCDQSVSSTFINKYIHELKIHNTSVIYGGRSYQLEVNPLYFLRWKYGRAREEKKALYRSKYPYKSFLTNNFLIQKTIFKSLLFDENMTGYGYEDALLSMQLIEKNISIIHIDNSAVHIGLETNMAFLQNTKNAMNNLNYLASSYQIPKHHIRIYDFFITLKKWKLNKLVYAALNPFLSYFEKQLCSKDPSLYLFDIFKLIHFLKRNQIHV